MTDKLTLRILTPVGTAFSGSVDAVFLPGSAGAFEVLPGHAPIISSLEKGRILWRQDGKEDSVEVRGGAIMVEDNNVTVCAQRES
jgi:F-type H+-transporting ATPase subunit epsilon